MAARAGGARGQREASREWRRRRRRERSPGMSLPPPPPGPLPLRRRRRRPALLGRTSGAGCAGPAAPLPPGTLASSPPSPLPPPAVTSSRGWGRAAGSSQAGPRGDGRLKGREAGEGPLSPQVTGPGSAEACCCCCCCCSPSSRRPRQASAPRATFTCPGLGGGAGKEGGGVCWLGCCG